MPSANSPSEEDHNISYIFLPCTETSGWTKPKNALCIISSFYGHLVQFFSMFIVNTLKIVLDFLDIIQKRDCDHNDDCANMPSHVTCVLLLWCYIFVEFVGLMIALLLLMPLLCNARIKNNNNNNNTLFGYSNVGLYCTKLYYQYQDKSSKCFKYEVWCIKIPIWCVCLDDCWCFYCFACRCIFLPNFIVDFTFITHMYVVSSMNIKPRIGILFLDFNDLP